MHEDHGQVVVGRRPTAEVGRLVDLDVQVERVVGDDDSPRAPQLAELDLLAGDPVADDPALPGDADRAGGGGQAGRADDGAEDTALDAHRVSSLSTWRRVSRPPIRVTTS